MGACLDEPSWALFKERCPPVAEAIARAESRLRAQSGGSLEAIDWTGCMGEPLQGMQGKWAGDLRSKERERLLASLGTDDRVDFRSSGGPGAGGYLEPPVVREGETPAKMPDEHFRVALKDKLRLPLCPPGATCKLRKADGALCGETLDRRGRHALKCPCGPYRNNKHNGLPDFCASYYQRIIEFVAVKEQRVAAWDKVNSTGGLGSSRRRNLTSPPPTR